MGRLGGLLGLSWGVWGSLGRVLGTSWRHLEWFLEALEACMRDAWVLTGFLHIFIRNFKVFLGGGSLKNLEKPKENLGFFDVLKDWQFFRNP